MTSTVIFCPILTTSFNVLDERDAQLRHVQLPVGGGAYVAHEDAVLGYCLHDSLQLRTDIHIVQRQRHLALLPIASPLPMTVAVI